jgi:hypothetical protein
VNYRLSRINFRYDLDKESFWDRDKFWSIAADRLNLGLGLLMPSAKPMRVANAPAGSGFKGNLENFEKSGVPETKIRDLPIVEDQ